MNKPLQTLIASCCVFGALAFARPCLAAPPTVEPTPRTLRLEIDVEDLGDKGIGLDHTVRERLGPQIAEADFELVDEDAAITLRVRFRALQSGEYDYGVHFEFIDEVGNTHEPAIEWVDCHMCVDARLMPVLDEQTPALIAALDTRAKALEPDVVDDDGADEPVAVAVVPPAAGPEPRPITGLGIGGAVVAGLGVGALIWAGVELSRGVVIELDNGHLEIEHVDHRPAGYALIGVGATALVTGAVLLGVDLGRQSKKRKQARTRQAHFYPVFTVDGAGLGISGRF